VQRKKSVTERAGRIEIFFTARVLLEYRYSTYNILPVSYQFGPPQGSGSAREVMQTCSVLWMTHPCASFVDIF